MSQATGTVDRDTRIRTAKAFATLAATLAIFVSIAAPASAGLYHPKPPIASFGPTGGACTGHLATGTGDIAAVTGTGDFTAGSNTVTNVTTTEGAFAVGMQVALPNLGSGITITAVGPGTLTLNTSSVGQSQTGVEIKAGSLEITSAAAGCGSFAVGQIVTAPGLLAEITAIGSGTLTLSRPPTVPGTGVALATDSRFTHADKLAFDQATQKLYAIDEGPEKLFGFDLSTPGTYTPLGAPFPFTIPIWGSFSRTSLAVDDSGGSSQGNVYTATPGVLPSGDNKIHGYDSSGAPLPGFPIASPPEPTGNGWTALAVDPDGNIWGSNLKEEKPVAYEYSPAGVPLNTVSLPQGRVYSLAFDASGDLYATVEGTVWKLAAPAHNDPVLFREGAPGAILNVDRASGDLYVATANHVSRYRSDGALLEEFATGLGGDIQGFTVDEASKAVYVSNAPSGITQTPSTIHVFGASVLPDLATAPLSDPTATTVTLHGSVDPSGLPLSGCKFEYVTEEAFQASGFADLSSGGEEACSPAFGSIPTSGTTAISAAISGLSEGVHYRYRLSASNANGTITTKGAPASFSLDQPVVETVGSPIRSATTARLDSRVDPHGIPTSYHFEYITDAAYQANLNASEPPFTGATSTPDHSAGSGALTELVSQHIEELTPATTYHYRVVADNGAFGGAATGEERTLTTRASDQPLSHGHFPGPTGSDRAWEQVSLPDSSGNPVAAAAAISDDGDRAAYLVTGGTHASEAGTFYDYLYARRPPGQHPGSGWQTESVFPSRLQAPFSAWRPPSADGSLSTMLSLNLDLVAGAAAAFWRIPTEGGAPSKLYEAKPGAYGELYLSSDDGSRALLVLRGENVDPAHPSPGGVAQLYDVSSGEPHMTSLLPGDIAPSCGVPGTSGGTSLFGFRPIDMDRSTHWVAADGSRAFFPSAGNSCGAPHLYVRDFAEAETFQVDGPLPGGLSGPAGPECPGALIRSTPEAAYFWTQSRLVEADTAIAGSCKESGPGGDVYRYDLASHAFQCLTCVVPGGLPANVTVTGGEAEGSHSIAVAADGSRLYFTTTTRLLPGAPETGTRAIYRVDTETGQLAYVGPLEATDRVGENPGGGSGHQGTAISPDGRFLSFRSADPALDALSGSDNGGSAQFYLYDDVERSLSCVSCPPDGSAPRAEAAQGIAAGAEPGPNMTSLAADGDFVFATPTALVNADQNTAPAGGEPSAGEDVYEWRDGRALLVSDGLTSWPSSGAVPQADAITPSGRDLFFTEPAQLTPDALDGYTRLYDARIGGGIEFPPESKPCPLEVCQGTPKGAPEEAAPGTSSFSGPGNAKEGDATKPRCSKGKVRRKGRCVTKKHKRAKRAAKHNRRGAR